MTDRTSPDIRFAIIRFADSTEARRLRLLLREYGYQEPTWLDSNGASISPPAVLHAAARDRTEPTSTPPCSSFQSSWATVFACGRGVASLRLPTVLEQSEWRPPQPSSSVVLPLVKTEPSTPSLSTSASVIPTVQTTPPRSGHDPQSRDAHSSSSDPPSSAQCPSSANPPSTDPPSADPPTDVVEAGPSMSQGARAWVNPAPLRPRGKKAQLHEDPNVYYTCTLCNNKILGTRVSNLQNHVRRHSMVKQFQCCYCDYAHNEIAKVRLHMTNNHKDSESAPVNNLNSEMQNIWRNLFRECFPTRAQRRRGARAKHQASAIQMGGASTSDDQPGPSGISRQSASHSGGHTVTASVALSSHTVTASSSHTVSAQGISERLFLMSRRRLPKEESDCEESEIVEGQAKNPINEQDIRQDHKMDLRIIQKVTGENNDNQEKKECSDGVHCYGDDKISTKMDLFFLISIFMVLFYRNVIYRLYQCDSITRY